MKYIKSITSLFAGFSFRGKVQPQAGGKLAVIQMKDLEHGYTSIGSNLTFIKGDHIKEKYFLRQGDVLFISKGVHNKALVYDRNLPRAVASSTFFVMRPRQDKVTPGYLAWFLNHPATQQRLKQNLTGTYTMNLNRKALEEIEVPLPSLHRQQLIAGVSRLQMKEKALLSALHDKRDQYIQTLLLNATHE